MKCRHCDNFNWTCNSSHPLNGCAQGIPRKKIDKQDTQAEVDKIKLEAKDENSQGNNCSRSRDA